MLRQWMRSSLRSANRTEAIYIASGSYRPSGRYPRRVVRMRAEKERSPDGVAESYRQLN